MTDVSTRRQKRLIKNTALPAKLIHKDPPGVTIETMEVMETMDTTAMMATHWHSAEFSIATAAMSRRWQ
jgi:hypothetical protein